MHVLLFTAPRERLDRRREDLPPVRLLTMAAALREYGDRPFVADGSVVPFGSDQLADHILTVGIDVAVCQVGMESSDQDARFLTEVRSKSGTPVIPWLPHTRPGDAERVLAVTSAPFVALGSCELRIPEILRRRDRRSTSWTEDGTHRSVPAETPPNLDAEPPPAYDLVDLSTYHYPQLPSPILLVEGSRRDAGGQWLIRSLLRVKGLIESARTSFHSAGIVLRDPLLAVDENRVADAVRLLGPSLKDLPLALELDVDPVTGPLADRLSAFGAVAVKATPAESR